jgi:hypothetical protein
MPSAAADNNRWSNGVTQGCQTVRCICKPDIQSRATSAEQRGLRRWVGSVVQTLAQTGSKTEQHLLSTRHLSEVHGRHSLARLVVSVSQFSNLATYSDQPIQRSRTVNMGYTNLIRAAC